MRTGQKTIFFYVPEATHKQIKTLCAARGISLRDLMTRLIHNYFLEGGK